MELEELWGLGEANLRQKVVHDVRVVPQQESPHITDDFPKQAWHHTTKEAPCTSSHAEKDLSDQNQQEDDQVDSVARDGGSVQYGLPGFGTCWYAPDGTVLFGHTYGGLVVGILKSIVDECGACNVSLGLELFGDIVIVRLAHGDERREKADEI